LGFLLAVPIIIIKLPAEYFLKYSTEGDGGDKKFTFSHLLYSIFKNIIGVILTLAGIAMLFLPGQGVITLLIGISLLSIPGKRDMMLKIMRQEKVLNTMNRLRSKFNKPPLEV